MNDEVSLIPFASGTTAVVIRSLLFVAYCCHLLTIVQRTL